MSNCIICSEKLNFLNKPAFNTGKLSDGNTVCTICQKKVNKIDLKIGLNLKKYSTEYIENLLNLVYGDLNKIIDDIKNLPILAPEIYLKRKEIKELPKILSKNEKIDNIIEGMYNGGIGILVSTNRRLIFIDKGILYGLKVEDFPLNKISSIQYETGLLSGKIKIHTTGNITTIDKVEKTSVRDFAEFVRNKIELKAETKNENQNDIFDKLEKLGNLKDKGILSNEEFEIQKKKLLNKI